MISMKDILQIVSDFLETLDYVTEGHASGGIIIPEDKVEMYTLAVDILTKELLIKVQEEINPMLQEEKGAING